MNKFYLHLFLTIFLLLSHSSVYAKETIKVLRIFKDNTILVKSKRGKEKIRLLGVRVPFKNKLDMYLRLSGLSKGGEGQKFVKSASRIFSEANKFIKKQIKEGNILYIDQFKRRDPLRDQSLYIIKLADKRILNLEMIKKGFSYPHTKNFNRNWKGRFHQAYQTALKKKKGLWRLWKWKETFSANQKKVRLPYRGQNKVSVMTYNLENLFDAQANSRNDHAYLPIQLKKSKEHIKKCKKQRFGRRECLKLDWSQKKFEEKMKRISRVILNAGPEKKGPDILLVQEMENFSILKKMVDDHLKGQGYQIHHLESRDFRGIDVAILSKLELAEVPEYHEIKFSKYKATRGILETTFLLPNQDLLTVFVLHFPSQFSETKFRRQALSFLDKLKDDLPPNRYVIAGGDCNIIKDEEAELYSDHLRGWKISHQTGCPDCVGTYYYARKDNWSFFDVFYYSENLSLPKGLPASWSIDPKSIRIMNTLPFQNTKDNTPHAFESVDEPGVSDHWPLYLEIKRSAVSPQPTIKK